MSGSGTDPDPSLGGLTPPWLSVVVVAITGDAVLAPCLEALARQPDAAAIEVIVVADASRAFGERLRDRFPSVRWLDAPPGTTVPHLRTHALARARGAIVALIEDDCLVEPTWAAAVRSAHAGTAVAVGGAVEPGPYRRGLDWAIYFCEYGRFMRPLAADSHSALALAGVNVSYKRSALADLDQRGGFVDYFVHDGWHRSGRPMRTDGAIGVRNIHTWSATHLTAVPFHHGRTFADRRAAGRPAAWRLTMGLLSLALPAIKLGRIIAATVSRGRLVGRLALSLPWVATFVTCWSAGETMGYLAGPGDSPDRWR